jgi:hypothetical protein
VAPLDQSTTHAAILAEADAFRATAAAADKRFATLRAQLALRGFELHITSSAGQPVFMVSRWSMVREFDTLAELEAFAAQAGVKP